MCWHAVVFPVCQQCEGPPWASCAVGIFFQQLWSCERPDYRILFSDALDGFHRFYLFTHLCACAHSSFSTASAEYSSMCTIDMSFRLLLSFWGLQCNPPHLSSRTQSLSKMMKSVFMQLISSPVTSSEVIRGCMMQNCMSFFSCLNSLLLALGVLLHFVYGVCMCVYTYIHIIYNDYI